MMAEDTTAATLAEGGEAHGEALLMGQGAEFWVYLSVAIFAVLAVVIGKLPSRIAAALDARIAAVKTQLDEAAALRAEAEALLADAEAKTAAAEAEAAAIRARAQTEAAALVAASEAAASEAITRRTAAAEARIAAAERAATAELKADVARQVTAAAAAIITARSDKEMLARLTDDAIAGLDRKLH